MNHAVRRVRQIAIVVSDVAVAVSYYRDVLGLKFLFSAGPNLAFLSDGEIRIMLSTPQGAGAVGQYSVIYFQMDDIESAFDAITSRGSALEQAPHLVAKMSDHDLWIGFVRDPDGNLIGLMEERRGTVP